jgi:hypothetical protein
MPKKWLTAERTMTLPRQIEMFMAQGKSAPQAYRDAGYRSRITQ